MGRPKKLTKDKIKKVHNAIVQTGADRKTCAALVGISERQFFKWLSDGRRDLKDEVDSIDAQFAHAIEEADAIIAAKMAEVVIQAGFNGTWQAAAWWLERRHPAQFAKRDWVTHQVDDTAGQQITINYTLADAVDASNAGGTDGDHD